MNDLIVSTTVTDPFAGAAEGIIGFGNGIMVAKSIQQGDWLVGSLFGASTFASEVQSLLSDPLGALASSAVSFLMEYCEPPRSFLDKVAGSPLAVQNQAETWHNIADGVRDAVSDYEAMLLETHGPWQGPAGDAYRSTATDYLDALTETSDVCDGIGAGLTGASGIVAFVRGIVRALIAELVGKLISWGAKLVLSLGVAAVDVARDAAVVIREYVLKIRQWFADLAESIDNLVFALAKLKNALSGSAPTLQKLTAVMHRQAGLGHAVQDLVEHVDPITLDSAKAAFNGARHSQLNQTSGVDDGGLDGHAPPA